MIIVAIAIGFASGIVAATASLLAGSGFMMAFGAYVLAGMVGTFASAVWMQMPSRCSSTAKQPITQRSY